MDERLDTRSVVRYHLPMKRHLPLFLLPFLSCIPFAHHPSTFEDVAPDAPPAITGPDARHEFQVRVLQPMTTSAVLEPGRVRVPRKNTPIPMLDLIKVLHDGHVVVFGYTPSRRRLAGALAQVRAENGNGVKVYNHNLGNIGLAPRMKAPFYHYGAGIFLVFPEFKAGAVAYWQTVQKCTVALAAFEQLDPTRAAHAFHRCGYHTTPPDAYAKVLRPLFWSSHKMLEAP